MKSENVIVFHSCRRIAVNGLLVKNYHILIMVNYVLILFLIFLLHVSIPVLYMPLCIFNLIYSYHKGRRECGIKQCQSHLIKSTFCEIKECK